MAQTDIDDAQLPDLGDDRKAVQAHALQLHCIDGRPVVDIVEGFLQVELGIDNILGAVIIFWGIYNILGAFIIFRGGIYNILGKNL